MSLKGINYPKKIPFSPRNIQQPSKEGATTDPVCGSAVKAVRELRKVHFGTQETNYYSPPESVSPTRAPKVKESYSFWR